LRNQRLDAGLVSKMTRVLVYYMRLITYAATARPRVFHILWNNKFDVFDRTLLMLYYKLLGKRIVFTAHNVNAGIRDGNDSWLNRTTLKFQYRLSDHLFVHTEKMKAELVAGFEVAPGKVTVIPFGINSTVPDTALTPAAARQRLGVGAQEKVLLFFGNIAPYKGLEYLVDAFLELHKADHRRQESVSGAPSSVLEPLPSALRSASSNYRLIIAGRPKGSEAYWSAISEKIKANPARGKLTLNIEYVPDAETEVFFKAADVLVLPYTHIFQSGVLFLGYNFGLPVIAADVGALKDEIVEGETGFIFRAKDAHALALTVEKYFGSALYRDREVQRQTIREYANRRYSWTKVGEMTRRVYRDLLTQ